MMETAQILRFYDNPEGERYVNLVDLVCWCHEYARFLMSQDNREGADAVAGVGLVMADQLEPEQPEGRTACASCGGPYDEETDSWGVCFDCFDSGVRP